MGESLCMGLSCAFLLTPTPSRAARARLDCPHNGLPARVHMDVLDRDLLLTLAPVPVQALQQGGVGARELVGWVRLSFRPSKVWSGIMARR